MRPGCQHSKWGPLCSRGLSGDPASSVLSSEDMSVLSHNSALLYVYTLLCASAHIILAGSKLASFFRVPGRNHSVSSNTSFHSSFSLRASALETPARVLPSSGQLLSMATCAWGGKGGRREGEASGRAAGAGRGKGMSAHHLFGHQPRLPHGRVHPRPELGVSDGVLVAGEDEGALVRTLLCVAAVGNHSVPVPLTHQVPPVGGGRGWAAQAAGGRGGGGP